MITMFQRLQLWQALVLAGVALLIVAVTTWRSVAASTAAVKVPEPVSAPAVPGIPR